MGHEERREMGARKARERREGGARGGALAVWDEGACEEDAPAARIIPQPGGVVLMLSEAIPHEVEVTQETRYGLAGWWRVNQSGVGRIDPLS